MQIANEICIKPQTLDLLARPIRIEDRSLPRVLLNPGSRAVSYKGVTSVIDLIARHLTSRNSVSQVWAKIQGVNRY
jgi:hypothetical protein